MIILDSASAEHFGCYGYDINTTPNIDEISKMSYVFTNAYTTAVYTKISVASIFTSLYPAVHKVYDKDAVLAEEAVTLAEILKMNSYKTALFTTTRNISNKNGLSQGFDEVYNFKYNVDPKIIIQEVIAWLKNNGNNNYFVYIH